MSIAVILFILFQNLLYHFLCYNYTGEISKNLLSQTQIFKDFFEICLVYCFCRDVSDPNPFSRSCRQYL